MFSYMTRPSASFTTYSEQALSHSTSISVPVIKAAPFAMSTTRSKISLTWLDFGARIKYRTLAFGWTTLGDAPPAFVYA